ncbi:MAG: hypothetical protein ACKOUM_03485, partial [Sphingopyxis sp.]
MPRTRSRVFAATRVAGLAARLAGATMLAMGSAGAAQAETVITAAHMVDVLTGQMVDYPAIFVGDDGRITGIADARTIRFGSNVTHIDLGEKTLLPGLIDMHVH